MFKSWGQLMEHFEYVCTELKNQQTQVELLVDLMVQAKNNEIVLLAVGRCADILHLFRVRLKQLGYVPSKLTRASDKFMEFVVPSTALVLCLSGSGLTQPTVDYAQAYMKRGAKLALITSYNDGPLVKRATVTVLISGISDDDIKEKINKPYDYGEKQKIRFDVNPPPTLFECGATIFFEGLVSSIHKALQETH